MTVGIITPVYGVARYLPQLITSIQFQTYTNLEIIFVLDGLVDESDVIIKNFAALDSRVVVIQQENAGLVSARKRGLREAKSDFIVYLDGDDFLAFNAIELLIKAQIPSNADIVVGGHYEVSRKHLSDICRNNIEQGTYNRKEIVTEIIPKMISYDDRSGFGIFSFSWGKLYKKNILEPIQLAVPDGINMGEDAAVTYPYIMASSTVSIISNPLVYYRQREGSMMVSTAKSYSGSQQIKKLSSYFESISITII